jgi:hypothetical protein
MLQTVGRSLRQLGEASPQVGTYLRSQLAPDGGFRDRSGRSDLYYTVFGLELLLALDEPVPPDSVSYLRGFGEGDGLDLVHLCCLIRSRASAGFPADAAGMMARLEAYRTPDGGYDSEPGAPAGSAYGAFLVVTAYEDLGMEVPARDTLLHGLAQLRSEDGGFGNQPQQAVGLTPTTAGIATLMRALGADGPPGLETWLLSQRHPDSGFFAVPGAPIPDLLSTATALHALVCLGVSLESFREPCLNFVRSLWTGNGAFAGSWDDPTPDCEYTYYGLLALGHLGL